MMIANATPDIIIINEVIPNAQRNALITIFPTKPIVYMVRRAERHFHLKRITVSTTNADYTIEVLPGSVFQHISQWLDMHPAEIKYEDLEAMLLNKFCPTSSVRAQRILNLSQQPMSDRTPSQI